MSCCLPPGRVLTRSEREAIARLRERRAAGLAPAATVHTAAMPRADPLVSFYTRRSPADGKTVGVKSTTSKSAKRGKKPRVTAHQLKKERVRRAEGMGIGDVRRGDKDGRREGGRKGNGYRSGEDKEYGIGEQGGESVGKGLRKQVREKWESVVRKVGGESAKRKEDLFSVGRSDSGAYGESQDRYFQELMTGSGTGVGARGGNVDSFGR